MPMATVESCTVTGGGSRCAQPGTMTPPSRRSARKIHSSAVVTARASTFFSAALRGPTACRRLRRK